MKSMAIIIRDDSYDKILTPLGFAYLQAAEGCQVDILFVSWAVRALTEDGARDIRIREGHSEQEAWMREQVGKAGFPENIRDLITAVKETGAVNLYACSMAAKIFGVDDSNMIPESSGIVGSSWFINEKAAPADYSQTF